MQGCRGALQTSLGTVPNAPFDFCVARKERRSYKDPKTGQLCTATRELGDAHYHLRVACVIPEGMPQSATKAVLRRSSVRESTTYCFCALLGLFSC